MISSEEPMRVNRPRPSMASGQMDGHINELARPSREIKTTEGKPWVSNAENANTSPAMADIYRAFGCEIYLGIQNTPMIYPISILTSVQLVKNLAFDKGMPWYEPYLMMVSPAITSTPT